MKLKNFFVGALILPTLIINSPLVSAEEVEIFGSEFDNDSKQVEVEVTENKTAPETPPQTETQPQEISTPTTSTPEVEISVPTEPEQPPQISISTPSTDTSNLDSENVEENDDENFGDELNFDNLNKPRTETPQTDLQPVQPEVKPVDVESENDINITYTPPQNTNVNVTTTVKQPSTTATKTKQQKLKMQKARFVKLTMDETYVYYLDKQTVAWKRLPYSSSEMMADVWIRMIERNDDNILPESEVDEIVFAKEEGMQFQPEDVEVLQHSRYHLEHYYLRPKTDQIQFLCELSDIEGRPQNTISERKYDYQNWEDLVPDSVESRIYRSVIKIIGKSRATSDRPVTFADYVEEYARISIR